MISIKQTQIDELEMKMELWERDRRRDEMRGWDMKEQKKEEKIKTGI